jgi:hypothetical protein
MVVGEIYIFKWFQLSDDGMKSPFTRELPLDKAGDADSEQA